MHPQSPRRSLNPKPKIPAPFETLEAITPSSSPQIQNPTAAYPYSQNTSSEQSQSPKPIGWRSQVPNPYLMNTIPINLHLTESPWTGSTAPKPITTFPKSAKPHPQHHPWLNNPTPHSLQSWNPNPPAVNPRSSKPLKFLLSLVPNP